MLLGGRLLQLWHCKSIYNPDNQDDIHPKNAGAKFELGDDNDFESEDEGKGKPVSSSNRDSKPHGSESIMIQKKLLLQYFSNFPSSPFADECGGYELVWEAQTAQPVRLLSFSPDGTLFATAGVNDTLVKVWFPDKPCKLTNRLIKANYGNVNARLFHLRILK